MDSAISLGIEIHNVGLCPGFVVLVGELMNSTQNRSGLLPLFNHSELFEIVSDKSRDHNTMFNIDDPRVAGKWVVWKKKRKKKA